MLPNNCANKYEGTKAQLNFPALAKAIVTAGFKCAPLALLEIYPPTKTAMVQPSTMDINPPLLPLVFGNTTLATTPFPMIIIIEVPKNSPKNGVIKLFFCDLYIGHLNCFFPTLNTFFYICLR